jgi:hypothetical protein
MFLNFKKGQIINQHLVDFKVMVKNRDKYFE